MINFIVLDFGKTDRKDEVYFGFGRHPADAVGDVFYSNHHELVELFQKLHQTLTRSEVAERYNVELSLAAGTGASA
jgi:hypothetical protein